MLSYICEITLIAVTPCGNRLEAVTSVPVFDERCIRVYDSTIQGFKSVPFSDGISFKVLKKLQPLFPADTSLKVFVERKPTNYPATCNPTSDAIVRDLFIQSFSLLDIQTQNIV